MLAPELQVLQFYGVTGAESDRVMSSHSCKNDGRLAFDF